MNELKITTPAGVAVWPRVEEPNKKFEPVYGKYELKLNFPADELQPIIDKIEDAFSKFLKEEEAEAKKKGKKVKVSQDKPYGPVLDSEGNETGNMYIKANLAAGGKSKDGKEYSRKLPVFDAKGQLIKGKLGISTGSVMKMSVEVRPYHIKECGVSLRLQAAQLIKLQTFGGSADTFGFGSEDDGYEFNADDAVNETPTTTTVDDTDDVPDFV